MGIAPSNIVTAVPSSPWWITTAEAVSSLQTPLYKVVIPAYVLCSSAASGLSKPLTHSETGKSSWKWILLFPVPSKILHVTRALHISYRFSIQMDICISSSDNKEF